MANKFVIRVYGILIQNNEILVSDEHVMGTSITKLPGGGLEFGEGTIECLEREFYEEMKCKVEVISHFYTTDFFVPSAFDSNFQVMSVYYKVQTKDDLNPLISKEAHDYRTNGGKQSFRKIPLSQLKESDFSLVIDKKVAVMLIDEFHSINKSG